MTLTQSDVSELLDAIRAGGDLDVIRKGVELVLQALIDVEAAEAIWKARRRSASPRSGVETGAPTSAGPIALIRCLNCFLDSTDPRLPIHRNEARP